MKHPVAVPILFVRTVARSQKRPEMFGSFPNTTGKFWDLLCIDQSTYMGAADGVFQTGAVSNNQVVTTTPLTSKGNQDGISFDLSRESSVFSGTKLQPSALLALPCIRF